MNFGKNLSIKEFLCFERTLTKPQATSFRLQAKPRIKISVLILLETCNLLLVACFFCPAETQILALRKNQGAKNARIPFNYVLWGKLPKFSYFLLHQKIQNCSHGNGSSVCSQYPLAQINKNNPIFLGELNLLISPSPFGTDKKNNVLCFL